MRLGYAAHRTGTPFGEPNRTVHCFPGASADRFNDEWRLHAIVWSKRAAKSVEAYFAGTRTATSSKKDWRYFARLAVDKVSASVSVNEISLSG